MIKELKEVRNALSDSKAEFWDDWHSNMSEGDFENHWLIMDIDKSLATLDRLSALSQDVNAELLEALKECLPRIDDIRLVDLGAVRDAEMQDYQERKILARRELAETNKLINKINQAIQRAEQSKGE